MTSLINEVPILMGPKNRVLKSHSKALVKEASSEFRTEGSAEKGVQNKDAVAWWCSTLAPRLDEWNGNPSVF